MQPLSEQIRNIAELAKKPLSNDFDTRRVEIITLKFKEVRLDASVAVVHKHSMGRSCEGRLMATPQGIRYDTANKNDAFAFPFGALEVFEIEYLKKELKVKQKGGKTWNFTDKSENADKLFVFHRDVTKAREKMAAQGK